MKLSIEKYLPFKEAKQRIRKIMLHERYNINKDNIWEVAALMDGISMNMNIEFNHRYTYAVFHLQEDGFLTAVEQQILKEQKGGA
ncbi:hypothetical protein N9M63_00265 [Candidatus Pelagibacter bacterium]|nr:hypothetical protein [Candidatus Pelagibacter bacterium]MDC1223937.1 hypothetical protein [Pelagibacteraceae bacterium]